MGKKEDKQIARIKSIPADYTFTELKSLVGRFGYIQFNRGKTSGSGVTFYRESDKKTIMLHSPHPKNTIGRATLRAIVKNLQENGDIEE